MHRFLRAFLGSIVLIAPLCGCQTTGNDIDMMQRMQENQRAAVMRAA